MRPVDYSILTAAILLIAGPCVSSALTNTQPNIVIIYADDMGYHGLSSYGNTYHETPNIDLLATTGMRFTDAHCGAPVCAPSRAVLMSGQYVSRHGVYRVNQVDNNHPEARNTVPPLNMTLLPLATETIADRMSAAGYDTVYCGKWHLGTESDPDHLPQNRGFDEALTTRQPSGSQRYFFPNFYTIPEVIYTNGMYLTDAVTQFATNFIHQSHTDPFFMYLPYFNVHGPLEARPERIAYYQAKDPSKTEDEAIFAAMHSHLDDAVGEIRDALTAEGLINDTLIIFTSDNGAVTKFTDELRGGKQFVYEGGIRVPMIANWPGHVPSGSTCSQAVHQVDLFPTCLELAGGTLPTNQVVDGVSIASVLAGNYQSELDERPLFWHYPTYTIYNSSAGAYDVTPFGAIRKGKWKVVNYFTSDRPLSEQVELFDLDADVNETTDLAGTYPEIASELMTILHNWRVDTAAPMPVEIVPGDGDLDDDNLPDTWEQQYYGHINFGIPGADSDGDTYDTTSEYIAGFDPTNILSVPSIASSSVDAGGAQFIINWETYEDRAYDIEWTDSLSNGFSNVATNLLYPQNSYTGTISGAESGFFRMKFRLQSP